MLRLLYRVRNKARFSPWPRKVRGSIFDCRRELTILRRISKAKQSRSRILTYPKEKASSRSLFGILEPELNHEQRLVRAHKPGHGSKSSPVGRFIVRSA